MLLLCCQYNLFQQNHEDDIPLSRPVICLCDIVDIEQSPSTTQSSPCGGVNISVKEQTLDQQITPTENQEGKIVAVNENGLSRNSLRRIHNYQQTR